MAKQGQIAGVGEILMEKIGLDALFDTMLLKRSKLGYLLKNALSEGAEDGEAIKLTETSAGKLASRVKGNGRTLPDDVYSVKANAAVHIDELATVSRADPGEATPDKGGRHGEFASKGWNYRTVYFQDADGNYYRLQISVAQNESGNTVYNIGRIEKRSFPTVYGSSAKSGALGGEASPERINNADTGSSAPVGGAQRRIISPSGVSVPQDGDAGQGKSTSTPGDAELQAAAKKLPELYRKNFLVNGKGVTNVKAYKSAYEAYALAGRIAAQTGKERFREAEEMCAGGFADILSNEKDIDSLARRYQKSYAKKEGQKSYADAMDEIVYDARKTCCSWHSNAAYSKWDWSYKQHPHRSCQREYFKANHR